MSKFIKFHVLSPQLSMPACVSAKYTTHIGSSRWSRERTICRPRSTGVVPLALATVGQGRPSVVQIATRTRYGCRLPRFPAHRARRLVRCSKPLQVAQWHKRVLCSPVAKFTASAFLGLIKLTPHKPRLIIQL